MYYFSFVTSSYLHFLFLLLITPHAKTSSFSTIPLDIINQTCKTCSEKSIIFNYNFCLTSLQPIPISHATNLQGLALIAMELALENSTNTIPSIKKMLSNKTVGPFALACLGDCLELYSGSVPTLVEAIGAFLLGQYGTANAKVSAVMEAAITCEERFIDKEGEVSLLTRENYSLFQLCDIVLCIIHLLSLS